MRPGTGTRRTCRWTTCSSATYTAERRALIGDTGQHRAAARVARWAPAPAPRPSSPGPPPRPGPPPAGRRGRRAHRRHARHDPRRHLPRRRRRPLGQHRLGHPLRRLAAELAGHPLARLRARHPGADVLAGAGPAQLAGPGQAARAPRSPRRWRCAAASPRSPSARPAATSRSSGSCASGWPTSLGGLDLQAAIDAPAWHTTSFPSSFYPRDMTPGEVVVESRLGERRHRRAAPPRAHGDRVRRLVAGPAVGGVVDPETGVLRAGANPRGMQGYAVGR